MPFAVGPRTAQNEQARLGDVMDYEVVEIDPGVGMAETTHAYRDASWISLKRRRPYAVDTVERRRAAFDDHAPH